MEISVERSPGEIGEPLSLLAAYADLYDLLLDRPDTELFLRRIAALAMSIAPGARCSLTVHQTGIDQVASVDPPGASTRIPRQATTRDHPRGHHGAAMHREISGGVALPLVVSGTTIATLSLYADPARPLRDADLEQVHTFAHQAATALVLLLRESAHLALDEQLQEALVTRTLIDQAMGVLMHARHISGRQALRMLRRVSQTTNRKVTVLAAEIITKMTGHPPEKPRPLTQRQAPPIPHQADPDSRP